MRKLILFAALAATVAPSTAIAQHRDWHHDREGRHERDNREWRRHHRTSYVAPYRNWRYRPVTVGYRLEPAFYGSRYYITDYGAYRLHAPGRWQRWIRYGDDLVLVNVRTGRVLDVVHYRYW